MTILMLETGDCRPVAAHCDAGFVNTRLADCRQVPTPLWCYPRLLQADAELRQNIEPMPMGLHWPELDEDISIASMLRGEKAPRAKAPESAQGTNR